MMPEIVLRQLCEYLQIRQETLLSARKQNPDQICLSLQKQEISLVTWKDADYPRKLRWITDVPYALYYKGSLVPDCAAVSVVGARKCSEYGRQTAFALGRSLAQNGIPVISGMAFGIDSEGHSGALKGGGKTWAVLGCGVDICYPSRSRRLYEQIPASGGGILSEFPPGTPPLPVNFPIRNRIISGLGDITVVVEAKLRSGSLITADFAMEQGKEVMAVPGRICDPWSAGTNHLISQGAGILTDVGQFLKDHNLCRENGRQEPDSKLSVLSGRENLMYRHLDYEPKYLDVLVDETGLNVREALEVLGVLKKADLVKETFKNYFCRTFQ